MLGQEHSYGKPQTPEFVNSLFKYGGETPRSAPGGLLVIAPDQERLHSLRSVVRNLLALREVQRTEKEKLGEDDVQELKRRLDQQTNRAYQLVLDTWSHLALWNGSNPPEWWLLRPQEKPGQSLGGLVLGCLKEADRYSDKLSPEELKERVFGPDENAKLYEDIWNMFFSVPGMPIVRERTVREAILEGVRTGILGIQNDEEILWQRLCADAALEPKTLVLRGEEAERRLANENRFPKPPPPPKGRNGGGWGGQPPKPKTKYRLRVKLPWDKVSDFQRGVVLPLQSSCHTVELEIELKAEASGGIPEGVLRDKVQETLSQLKLQPLEESWE